MSERTANEQAHAQAVREMFAGIATKYDFLNHFLSVNIDKRWRKLVRQKLEKELNDVNALILDVACGTGDLSVELQQNGTAKVIGTDFCRPMLTIAAEKNAKNNLSIPYLEGDGMNLAFPDETFDLAFFCGVLEYVPLDEALHESARVLKTGAPLVLLPVKPSIVGSVLELLYNFKIHPLQSVKETASKYFNIICNHEFPITEPISWSKTIFVLEKK